jgi:hypothetical protein
MYFLLLLGTQTNKIYNLRFQKKKIILNEAYIEIK